MGDFYGMATEQIANELLTLEYLRDAGPRIVSLKLHGNEENFLAEIPEKTITTHHGLYNIYGGHRLWVAPEDLDRTYIPDNDPITITKVSNGVILTQAPETITHIQKIIELKLINDHPALEVSHTLVNTGVWPITLSAWAITLLPLGGTAYLPQTTDPLDPNGLLPNRNIVFWPYSQLDDQRLILTPDHLRVKANPATKPLKIGYANRAGWLGYIYKNIIFIKHFFPVPLLTYPDMGSSAEVYCNNQYIELETLSPLTKIQPGQSLLHREVWEIRLSKDQSMGYESLQQMIQKWLPATTR